MSGIILTYKGKAKSKVIQDPGSLAAYASPVVKSMQISLGRQGPIGPAGPAGVGVPTGGTAGQVLSKIDSTNYNTQWSNPAAAGVVSFNTRTGAVTLLGSDVTAALGYTPYDASNPSGYISTISGIAAGGELTGTYANPSLSNAAVIAKVLTGLNITGGTVLASDSILTAFGKLQNQISGVLGGATYQGVWNATTNSPTLASSTGTKGFYYIVSVAGATNLDGITDWQVGDWAIFNGTAWNKVDNTDAVSSVNGFTGAVSLTTANISEVTNLYYTNARGIGSVLTGYTSGTGVVAATDTILQAIQKLNGNIGAIVSGVSSVSNSDTTLTVSPTTGPVVASLNLATANTWTGAITVQKDALAATTIAGLTLINTTPAVLNTVQVSPAIYQRGNVWNTTSSGSSNTIDFRQYVFPVQNTTNPVPEWRMDYSKNGAAFTNGLSFSTNGNQFRFYQAGSSTVYGSISMDVNGFIALGSNGGSSVNINIPAGSTMRTASTRSGAGTWMQWLSSGAAPSTGDSVLFDLHEQATWSSGAGTYSALLISNTINQTSTASGIVRGLWINPTLTSVTGEYRAIDIAAGKVVFAAGVTARAPLNIPGGVAPTSPVNGDVFNDSTHLYVRLGGVTYQLDQQTGGSSLSVVTKTGNYTTTSTDDVILVDASGGAVQITLLTPASLLKPQHVKKIDSSANAVTVIGAAGTIDGSASAVWNVPNVSYSFVSDLTNYFVI